jgi:hypothetical protein
MLGVSWEHRKREQSLLRIRRRKKVNTPAFLTNRMHSQGKEQGGSSRI